MGHFWQGQPFQERVIRVDVELLVHDDRLVDGSADVLLHGLLHGKLTRQGTYDRHRVQPGHSHSSHVHGGWWTSHPILRSVATSVVSIPVSAVTTVIATFVACSTALLLFLGDFHCQCFLLHLGAIQCFHCFLCLLQVFKLNEGIGLDNVVVVYFAERLEQIQELLGLATHREVTTEDGRGGHDEREVVVGRKVMDKILY